MPRACALTTIVSCVTALVVVAAPAQAASPKPASGGQEAPLTPQSTDGAAAGGAEYGTADTASTPTVPGPAARITATGLAAAPADAPPAVQQMIWAANKIIGRPYRYGGGHGASFADSAYDCSGTVSFALHGGGLLTRPLDSSSFFAWEKKGAGRWVTVYTNSGHAYMTIAGIRLDTSAAYDPAGGKGPRWRPLRTTDRGYRVRHPAGL